MLVEHRVHDVDERFVRGEQTVPAGEKIALQPTLAGCLAEHFHDSTFGAQVLVRWQAFGNPHPVGHFEHRAEPIGRQLVGSDDTEVSPVGISRHDVSQKSAEHARRLS